MKKKVLIMKQTTEIYKLKKQIKSLQINLQAYETARRNVQNTIDLELLRLDYDRR